MTDETLDLLTAPLTRRSFLLGAAGLPALGNLAKTAIAVLPKAAFVTHGPKGSPQVALTFHGAGDPALTRRVLAITKTLKAPITVFAVGNWAEANPELIRGLLDNGHELANHTYSHPSLRRLGRKAVGLEISKCAAVLRTADATIGKWFRPSGTPTPTDLMLEEASKVGYSTVVGYSVDPLDYQDPGASLVVSRTLAGATGGSIVSLHLGHVGTVDALEKIVTGLRKRGLEPVTVSALLRS